MDKITPDDLNAIAERRKAKGLHLEIPPPLAAMTEQQRQFYFQGLEKLIEGRLPFGGAISGRALFALLIVGEHDTFYLSNARTDEQLNRIAWVVASGGGLPNPVLSALIELWRAVEFYDRAKTEENEKPLSEAMERAEVVLKALGVDPRGINEQPKPENP